MSYLLETPPVVLRAPVERINSHSKLSDIVRVFEAPPPKTESPQKKTGIKPWEKKMRLDHHVMRMKTFAKSAESPNLTLREIQTGKKDKTVERIILAMYTYFVGLAFIFFMLKN